MLEVTFIYPIERQQERIHFLLLFFFHNHSFAQLMGKTVSLVFLGQFGVSAMVMCSTVYIITMVSEHRCMAIDAADKNIESF